MATGRRRGRAFIYIALILILLLVLVFALTRMGGGIPGVTQEPAPENVAGPAPTATVPVDTVDIVVTTQKINRGVEISADLIQIVPIPREDYTEGVFFNTTEDVIGGRAKYDLEPHTPLTNALMIPLGSQESIPAFDIPKGMVAISIPIGKLSSVSYGLQKGDHVNVLVSLLLVDLDTNFQTKLPNRTGVVIAPGPIDENQTYVTAVLQSPEEYSVNASIAYPYLGRIELDPTMNNPVFVLPSEPQRPRLVSQTLIQDAVVLQMGDFPLGVEAQQAAEAAAAAEEQNNQQQTEEAPPPAPVLPEVITLIVSPQDALTLNYLMLSNASINLVMRSAGDDQRVDTEAVTLQFILDQHRIPNPAKLPYGLEPRINNAPNTIPAFPDPAQDSVQEATQ